MISRLHYTSNLRAGPTVLEGCADFTTALRTSNSELAAGTDIAKMVLQIMGSDSAAHGPEEPNALSQSDAAGVSGDPSIDAPQNSPLDLPLEPVRLSAPSTPAAADHEVTEHVEVENTQNAELKQSGASQQEVRRHGTAKPRV